MSHENRQIWRASNGSARPRAYKRGFARKGCPKNIQHTFCIILLIDPFFSEFAWICMEISSVDTAGRPLPSTLYIYVVPKRFLYLYGDLIRKQCVKDFKCMRISCQEAAKRASQTASKPWPAWAVSRKNTPKHSLRPKRNLNDSKESSARKFNNAMMLA